MKKHDDWKESARIWVAEVGNPSTKKSPLIKAASRPLCAIDDQLRRDHRTDYAAYAALDKEEKAQTPPPIESRLRIEDATVEATQEVLRSNSGGVLLLRDELSGWFGSMEKYGSAKGAASDRSFWLQAFNGGSAAVDRVGRGSVHIPNLSVCLLGGIQPDPLRKIAAETSDDGLLQRIIPIILRPSVLGKDEEAPPVVAEYDRLINRLYAMKPPLAGGLQITPLRFSDAAQEIRRDMEVKHHDMAAAWELVNKKLAAHIGKYDGIFARLCLIWHCAEAAGGPLQIEVSATTASRVAEFLHSYLLKHAIAFYTSVLGLSDRHDALLATAGYILAHQCKEITSSALAQGDRVMRNLTLRERESALVQLDGFGWLDPIPLERNQTSPRYKVRAAVHEIFDERAELEASRRSRVRSLIAESLTEIE